VHQGRRLGLIRPSSRLQVQAPLIPSTHLIPLPQGSLRCRQPFSGKPKNPVAVSDEPALPPDPARDRVVAWLVKREAELLARTRPARPPIPKSTRVRLADPEHLPGLPRLPHRGAIPGMSTAVSRPVLTSVVESTRTCGRRAMRCL